MSTSTVEKSTLVPSLVTSNKKSLNYLTPPESVTDSSLVAAPGGWFTCNVVAAGPAEDGTIFVRLRDVGGSFPDRWYYAVKEMRNEILATALLAVNSGFPVWAYIVSTDDYSQLNRIYVVRA